MSLGLGYAFNLMTTITCHKHGEMAGKHVLRASAAPYPTFIKLRGIISRKCKAHKGKLTGNLAGEG